MKIIDKVCGKIGLMNNDDITEDKGEEMAPEETREPSRPEAAAPHNVVDFQSSAASIRETVATAKMKVIVIEPKSFDDAQQVANCLKEKRPVVINFEGVDDQLYRRILDFVSGTTYALDGNVNSISTRVWLFSPKNVNVSVNKQTNQGFTDMPWENK